MPRETIEQIVTGLYRIRIPIPPESLRYVYVYLVRNGGHNLLIDTGWNSDEAYGALSSALSTIRLQIRDLEKIVISHNHPDHVGLCPRLKLEAPGCVIAMHHEGAERFEGSLLGKAQLIDKYVEFLKLHGVPDTILKDMIEEFRAAVNSFQPVTPDIQLQGGENIKIGADRSFQVISTPGHARENICLYETGGSKILFSGDHILPTITPNISFSFDESGDPLGDYLQSLEGLRKLDVIKVLPSHEFVFTGLKKRIDELILHHRERLEEITHILKQGSKMSAFELARRLTWSLGRFDNLITFHRRLALGETLAHLEYLLRRNEIRYTRDPSTGGLRAELCGAQS